jgi:hypothetical protein
MILCSCCCLRPVKRELMRAARAAELQRNVSPAACWFGGCRGIKTIPLQSENDFRTREKYKQEKMRKILKKKKKEKKIASKKKNEKIDDISE